MESSSEGLGTLPSSADASAPAVAASMIALIPLASERQSAATPVPPWPSGICVTRRNKAQAITLAASSAPRSAMAVSSFQKGRYDNLPGLGGNL
eukprot:jgi/Chrpa1/8822/Chrysochromulina_OHIO_Genome00017109-RA